MTRRFSIGCAAAILCLVLPVGVVSGRVAGRATEASNRAMAAQDVEERLAAMPIPSETRSDAGPPPATGALLEGPAIRSASPNLIDLTSWWSVPGAPAEVLDWFRANLPSGTRIGIEGSTIRETAVEDLYVVVVWPRLPEMVAERRVVAGVTALPGGETAVRLDSQATWIVPHPASERIPAAARLLEVEWRGHRRAPALRAVGNGRFVHRIAALMNRLPVVQPGIIHCPAIRSHPRTVALRFRARRDGPLLAEAFQTLPPGGCSAMSLTIRGARQPALEGAGPVIARLRPLLSVR